MTSNKSLAVTIYNRNERAIEATLWYDATAAPDVIQRLEDLVAKCTVDRQSPAGFAGKFARLCPPNSLLGAFRLPIGTADDCNHVEIRVNDDGHFDGFTWIVSPRIDSQPIAEKQA